MSTMSKHELLNADFPGSLNVENVPTDEVLCTDFPSSLNVENACFQLSHLNHEALFLART